mgnify:CR=1 FL=1
MREIYDMVLHLQQIFVLAYIETLSMIQIICTFTDIVYSQCCDTDTYA